MKYFISLMFLIVIVFQDVSCFEMVTIPSGVYTMGTENEFFPLSGSTDELPESSYHPHEVHISSFKISKYEIDSDLFLKFLSEKGRSPFDQTNVYDKLLKLNDKNYTGFPAVSTYFYALDFCKWLSQKEKKHYRLPTEAEWEYVATGGNDYQYPWGNKYIQLSIAQEQQRVDLKKYSKDESPFGVMNMYGNVAEWVADYYQYNAYEISEDKNPVCIDGKQTSKDGSYEFPPLYVVRGLNNYFYDLNQIEIPIQMFTGIKRRYPYWHNTLEPYIHIGFRVVEDSGKTSFYTNGSMVDYFYRDALAMKDIQLRTHPTINSELIGSICKGESIKIMFSLINEDCSQWYRIQTMQYNSNDDEGKKMGDYGKVGWVLKSEVEINEY